MRLSVVIPVFNRADQISTCLRSLSRQTRLADEIILVDDASGDALGDAVRAVKGFAPGVVTILRQDARRGPSACRNLALQHASGDLVFFIDSDAEAEPDWIEKLAQPFCFSDDIVLAGGIILDRAARTYWEAVNRGGDRVADCEGVVPMVIGCNMAGRRDFLAAHPFHERPAAEDYDLACQARAQGKKVYYYPPARVVHSRRPDFKGTLSQQFAYGFENTRVNLRRNIFPYLSRGALILAGAMVFFLAAGLANRDLLVFAQAFLAGYAALAAGLNVTWKWPHPVLALVTLPGFFLRCLAHSCGSLCSFFAYFFRRENILWMFHGARRSSLSGDLESDLGEGSPGRISCLVCASRPAESVRGLLDDLARQSVGRSAFELVLVDNGVTGLQDLVGQYAGELDIKYLREKRQGVEIGALRNRTLAASAGEYLLLLDDDTQISDRDFLQKSRRLFETTGADIILPRGQASGAGWLDPYSFAARCCLYRRSFINRIKGFRSALFSYEDIEMGIRSVLDNARVEKAGTLVYAHPGMGFSSWDKPLSIGQNIYRLRAYYPWHLWLLIYFNGLRFLPLAFIPKRSNRPWAMISLGVLFGPMMTKAYRY